MSKPYNKWPKETGEIVNRVIQYFNNLQQSERNSNVAIPISYAGVKNMSPALHLLFTECNNNPVYASIKTLLEQGYINPKQANEILKANQNTMTKTESKVIRNYITKFEKGNKVHIKEQQTAMPTEKTVFHEMVDTAMKETDLGKSPARTNFVFKDYYNDVDPTTQYMIDEYVQKHGLPKSDKERSAMVEYVEKTQPEYFKQLEKLWVPEWNAAMKANDGIQLMKLLYQTDFGEYLRHRNDLKESSQMHKVAAQLAAKYFDDVFYNKIPGIKPGEAGNHVFGLVTENPHLESVFRYTENPKFFRELLNYADDLAEREMCVALHPTKDELVDSRGNIITDPYEASSLARTGRATDCANYDYDPNAPSAYVASKQYNEQKNEQNNEQNNQDNEQDNYDNNDINYFNEDDNSIQNYQNYQPETIPGPLGINLFTDRLNNTTPYSFGTKLLIGLGGVGLLGGGIWAGKKIYDHFWGDESKNKDKEAESQKVALEKQRAEMLKLQLEHERQMQQQMHNYGIRQMNQATQKGINNYVNTNPQGQQGMAGANRMNNAPVFNYDVHY